MKFFENETQIVNVVDNILVAESGDDDIHMVRPHGRKVFRFPTWFNKHHGEYINCSSVEIEHDGRHRHLIWPHNPDAEIKLTISDGQIKVVMMRNIKNLALFCSDQKTLMKAWTPATMPGVAPVEKNFNLLCGSDIVDCAPDDVYKPREMWSEQTTGTPYSGKADFTKDKAFDGTNKAAIPSAPTSSMVFTLANPIALDPAIPDNIKFEVSARYPKGPSSNRGRIKVNGINVREEGFTESPKIHIPVFEGDIGDTVYSIEWETIGDGSGWWEDHTNMRRIWINGKELVDLDIDFGC